MGYAVILAWLIQAAVGATLLVSWARHARGRDAGLVLTHVTMMIGFLVPWTAFVATGVVAWAWAGFAILLVFIGFGDATMVRRARAVTGVSEPGARDYWRAVRVALKGRLGWRVTFHALFAPVVFFGSLAVCIIATVAA
ncbi:hypothetical protein [Microbacterium sp. NPDC058389]|uniref:hypothetical protein n=1 Tax=Microbacterium sp. NPDC058389 TaxID=3346475 RepID=UPI003653AB7C